MRRILIACAISALIWGCGGDKEECAFVPETEALDMDIEFEPLHDIFSSVKSKEELVELFTRHPVIRDEVFRRAEYPGDTVFVNDNYGKLTNPNFDSLEMEVKRVFGDLSALKAEFTEAFRNLKYYYPDFTPPKVQTVITGLSGSDLYVSDSLIVVSLDYFLGKGARYRPKMYEYLLRKYDPNDIVPSCLLIYGIGDRYNKTEIRDKTVLADMIAYGKAFYFAKHMLPCTPDSVFIWYTPQEISGSRKNEDLIWKRLIESQVLFSTSHKTKQDYLGERPVTIQVGEKCPGRIGQWIGWQIVNTYADSHSQLTLPKLMESGNAQKIFKESSYKP